MSTMFVNRVQELNVGSGVQIPGHVVQTVIVENSDIGGRVSTSSTSVTELKTDYRINITPKKVGNIIICEWQYHLYVPSGSYGGIFPYVSVDGGPFVSATAVMNNNSGYAKGFAPSAYANETHRNSGSSGGFWAPYTQKCYHTVTSLTPHIFTLYVNLGAGSFTQGDNGPNTIAQAMEIAV